jgi:hypothetical protein
MTRSPALTFRGSKQAQILVLLVAILTAEDRRRWNEPIDREINPDVRAGQFSV